MSLPMRTRGRRIFDGFAVAVLAGFALFTAVMVLCAFAIPALREREKRLQRAQMTLASVRYQRVAFSADGSTVTFDRVEELVDPEGRIERELKPRSAPTGRTSGEPPAGWRYDEVHEFAARLLRAYKLAPGDDFELALSPDFREIAFLAEGTVVHRSAQGRFRALADGPLPDVLQRLSGVERSTTSRDPAEWADAAIDAILRTGPYPSLFAERILAVHPDAPAEIEPLSDLLVSVESDATPAEAWKVVRGVRDASLQRRLIHATQRMEKPEDAALRLLGQAAHEGPGEEATDYLKGWMLDALDEGTYSQLDGSQKISYLNRLRGLLGPAYAARLARVVTTRPAVEGAAAFVLLRHAVGEPPDDSAPRPDRIGAARAWVDRLRSRRPELFQP